jgi:hypothetical protein
MQDEKDTTLPPELQYLKDAGEDITEFLPQPAAEPAAEPAKVVEPVAKTAAEPQDGETEPGEVVVGDDGRIRDGKGRFVPKDAYVRQRQRATTAEKEAADLRERLARIDERLKVAGETKKAEDGKKAANPFDEEDIDPEADIVGATKQERRRNAWLREQHKQAAQAAQETGARLTETDMMQTYRDDSARFAGKQADYPAAYKHLVVSRARELIAFGITDKESITKQIAEDEREIVRQATANGKSAPEMMYALAVAKGYQAPAAEQTTQQQTMQQQQTTQQPAGKTPAQETVERIQQGQETGKTLTGAGGGAATGLTIEQFLAMTPDEILAMRGTPQGRAQLQAIGAY